MTECDEEEVMSDTIATATDQPALSGRESGTSTPSSLDSTQSLCRRSIGGCDTNPLHGIGFGFQLDEVLEEGPVFPTLFAGHSLSGDRYLVRHADSAPRLGTWLFASITEHALSCVREGRGELRAAFAHTATGAVELITVAPDGHYTESLKLCSELADEELPPSGTHLRLCA
jgi:hypothetical protein